MFNIKKSIGTIFFLLQITMNATTSATTVHKVHLVLTMMVLTRVGAIVDIGAMQLATVLVCKAFLRFVLVLKNIDTLYIGVLSQQTLIS